MTLAKRIVSAVIGARAQVSRNLSRHLPYYLTPEEAHPLINSTENERDRLLLRLLWETGVRVSEAIRIQLGDVARDGIRVLGKGGFERVVFIQDGLVTAILFYAQEMALGRDDYLFQSRRGGHVTKQRADQIIKSAARRAGLERNVYAHLFRHGYAINFLNCGGRLDALQEQLGHRVLRRLVAEGVYIRDLRRVLMALADWGRVEGRSAHADRVRARRVAAPDHAPV